jgi:RNA polymerase sigma-70 factor (ECF subfamily)
MTDDRELIRRTLNGDRAAFDDIVRRYQDGLFRHLLRLVGRCEEAEDLCQEGFIRFYRALPRFNRARPVGPFLFAIATNLWREQARKTHLPEQPLDEQVPVDGPPVAEQVMARLEHEQVLAAVAQLRPEQREAVSLYYDQGLSYREIARVTRAPVGTVSTRLRRALESLRRALPGEAAGLAIIAGGQAPPATSLVTALQGQGAAPPSLAPAVAHNIAHAAPATVGLLHGIWTLWKEAGLMVKGIYVALGLAVVGGATVGVPRLVSSTLAAASRQAKAPAVVRQFSADVTSRTYGPHGMTMAQKVFIKGPKSRREWTVGGRAFIDIQRRDKRVAWKVFPDTRTYIELEYPARFARGNAMDAELSDLATLRAREDIADARLIGSGKMSGYQCDEYAITYRDSPVRSQRVWIARKLKWVVRREVSDPAGMSGFSQATNIQERPLPDALFEIPAGYKKTSQEARIPEPECVRNANWLAGALRMFAQDYGGQIPNAATWMDDIKPYLRSEDVLRCPGEKHKYSYAMNVVMSGRKLSEIADPANTVILYEFSSDTRSAAGEPPSPSVPGLRPGGRVYAYADGTAESVRAQ